MGQDVRNQSPTVAYAVPASQPLRVLFPQLEKRFSRPMGARRTFRSILGL